MFPTIGRWKRRISVVMAILILATLSAAGGCGAFGKQPKDSPYSRARTPAQRSKQKSDGPLAKFGSLFSSDEPMPAESIDQFMSQDRPDL